METGCSYEEAGGKITKAADGARRRGRCRVRPFERREPQSAGRASFASRAHPQGERATSALAERTTPSIEIRCEDCGGSYLLSVRRAFEVRQGRGRALCRVCRRPTRKMSAAERERFQRWWREESGLSLREFHALTFGLAGE